MKPLDHLSIIDETLDVLRKDLVVTDVVYNPQKSKLLQQAEEAGATTINGLGMMLWQGALGFKLFTGEEMPREEIKKIMFNKVFLISRKTIWKKDPSSNCLSEGSFFVILTIQKLSQKTKQTFD